MEGGREGGREETSQVTQVCVLRLNDDGKHFYHDSAILDTNMNYFKILLLLLFILCLFAVLIFWVLIQIFFTASYNM